MSLFKDYYHYRMCCDNASIIYVHF